MDLEGHVSMLVEDFYSSTKTLLLILLLVESSLGLRLAVPASYIMYLM